MQTEGILKAVMTRPCEWTSPSFGVSDPNDKEEGRFRIITTDLGTGAFTASGENVFVKAEVICNVSS